MGNGFWCFSRPQAFSTWGDESMTYAQSLMRLMRWLTVVALLAALAACSKPVPPNKASYVGLWRNASIYLLITADGNVQYKKVKGSVNTTINAPIKEFDGDNFVVGVGVFATTFVVTKRPYPDGDSWKMVVDGELLTRDPSVGGPDSVRI
jgi:hypothetical protein